MDCCKFWCSWLIISANLFIDSTVKLIYLSDESFWTTLGFCCSFWSLKTTSTSFLEICLGTDLARAVFRSWVILGRLLDLFYFEVRPEKVKFGRTTTPWAVFLSTEALLACLVDPVGLLFSLLWLLPRDLRGILEDDLASLDLALFLDPTVS